MSGIRGKNTKPEIVVRQALHQAGFRFRIHRKELPGKPDIVLPKYRAVIFVHGCFWHGHGCHLFKWPSTHRDFWQKKISSNISRDKDNVSSLNSADWKVLNIWECTLKGKSRLDTAELVLAIKEWLNGPRITGDIAGEKIRN